MSDNRFLPSLCAFLGAATLVCGTQIFLLATWDWDSTTLDVEPLAPASATISIELSEPRNGVAEDDVALAPISVGAATQDDFAAPEVIQPLAVEQPAVSSRAAQSTASTEQAQITLGDRSHITAEARVGDHTPPASANINLLVGQPRIKGDADVLFVGRFTTEARVGHRTSRAPARATLSIEEAAKGDIAGSEFAPEARQVESIKISELGTKVAGLKISQSTVTDGDAVDSSSDIQIMQASSQPSLPQETWTAQPLQAGTADNIPVASKQPPPPGRAQTGSISIAAPELKYKKSSQKVLLPKQASEPVKKKPSAQVGPNVKSTPKPAPKPNQTKISQVNPRWQPMDLAPADKPSISATQSQPKRSDTGSYDAKIWSALARKKPKADQRGSTTVNFAIGPTGVLRFVRVSQSSSNSRLDQLALAAVRNAAPFPPPPMLKNGAAAYTIRIDFH